MNQEIPEGFCQCGCGQLTNLASQSSSRFGWIKGQPVRFIMGHRSRMPMTTPRTLKPVCINGHSMTGENLYFSTTHGKTRRHCKACRLKIHTRLTEKLREGRPPKPSFLERFEEKYHPVTETGCWIWLGHMQQNGYGKFFVGNKTHKIAHCVAYELYKGPIAQGMDCDHLCRTRCCVNPDHLEIVTRSVNLLRGIGPQQRKDFFAQRTHCKHGHSLSEENIYVYEKIGYRCRQCRTCTRLRGAARLKLHREEINRRKGEQRAAKREATS